MDAKEFQRQLTALEHRFDTDPVNNKSHGLTDCTRCSSCVFCTGSDRCYKCSYCSQCVNSTNLTHRSSCISSHNMANSVECTNCTNSAFLVQCKDMTECNYCFGCVGLSRKDFHILNEPYSRSEYFKITDKLFKTLRIKKP